MEDKMSDCGCKIEAKNAQQRKTLRMVLLVNLIMFLIESFMGVIAQSTALIADSLDMLADAIVYAISLYAVSGSQLLKNKAAFLSGIFQITLAFFVLIDVVKKIMFNSFPEFLIMGGIGLCALLANIYCLILISKHKDEEIHMKASWIFSKNDVIANFAVILAGIMVYLFNSNLPDLIVGLAISALVLWGGIIIIKESKTTNNNPSN
jgi:cation diffusion facilitator family transporter